MNFMPNAIVKNVLACLILVVLCVIIGAEAAESKKVSLGIIALLVGGGFLLWLGVRSWVLVFLIPPVLSLIPLPGKLAAVPGPYLVGLLVLVYWFVMWGMGYVKFRWRGLLSLDLAILLVFVYMAISYIRNPVVMAVISIEGDSVGGREYIYCILASLFYLTVSCIPCSYEQVTRVMGWAVKLSLVACLVAVGLGLAGYVGGETSLQDSVTETRFTMFLQLGLYGIYILYGQYPMSKVLLSPLIFFGCALSCMGILLSGWREQMMAAGFIVLALSFIKRELWCMILALMSVYATLLYLSHEEIVKEFPYGIQRCISILPGIEVAPDVAAGTEHSTDWRIEMWKWALDPRTRYINDYVWGDGFGVSVDYLKRETTAMMRAGSAYDIQDRLARTGEWHNGAIASVHRLGYVGLGIITLVYVMCTCLMLRVCRSLRGTPLYLPSLVFVLPYAAQPSLFYISAGTITKFFNTYVAISMIKFFYCVAREQGIIVPWHLRQRYIPLAIQAHEERLRPAEP